MLPERLNQIPPDQDIGSVTADGAYDTRKCHDAIAARKAFAVIPPRKNAKPWKLNSAGAIARKEAVNALRYLATVERVPPQKTRRAQDALCKNDWANP